MMCGGQSQRMGGDREGTGFTGQHKMVSGAGLFFRPFLKKKFVKIAQSAVLPTFVYPLLNG